MLLAEPGRDGVRGDGVVETDDPTTLAVAELDEQVRRVPVLPRGDLGGGPDRADAAGVVTAAATALHVGTLGLVIEPVGTTIERLVDTVASHPGS